MDYYLYLRRCSIQQHGLMFQPFCNTSGKYGKIYIRQGKCICGNAFFTFSLPVIVVLLRLKPLRQQNTFLLLLMIGIWLPRAPAIIVN